MTQRIRSRSNRRLRRPQIAFCHYWAHERCPAIVHRRYIPTPLGHRHGTCNHSTDTTYFYRERQRDHRKRRRLKRRRTGWGPGR